MSGIVYILGWSSCACTERSRWSFKIKTRANEGWMSNQTRKKCSRTIVEWIFNSSSRLSTRYSGFISWRRNLKLYGLHPLDGIFPGNCRRWRHTKPSDVTPKRADVARNRKNWKGFVRFFFCHQFHVGNNLFQIGEVSALEKWRMQTMLQR